MKPSIHVRGLSKSYQLDDGRDRYQTLRDAIAQGAANLARRIGRPGAPRPRATSPGASVLWALRDVDLDVAPGEVVGVIGRNGAGKSTILKILSRITEPTLGRAEIRGKVGSLLEIGTGFHPELTGRENIYLSGAILGMRRKEIESRFDGIVAFSEIPRFIDQPVKRYSSGMYVRLAFAVAAHLQPSVLIIDEVLAVGDAAFQQKCLGKIKDVADGGRTVLFVSHNMSAVQAFCQRAIYLDGGRRLDDGPAPAVVARYLEDINNLSRRRLSERTDRGGRGRTRLSDVEVLCPDGGVQIRTGGPARFIFRLSRLLPATACQFTIFDQYGVHLVGCRTSNRGPEDEVIAGLGPTFECDIDELDLLPGPYRINVSIQAEGDLQDQVEGAAVFHVQAGQVRGRTVADGIQYGRVFFPHRWKIPAMPSARE